MGLGLMQDISRERKLLNEKQGSYRLDNWWESSFEERDKVYRPSPSIFAGTIVKIDNCQRGICRFCAGKYSMLIDPGRIW